MTKLPPLAFGVLLLVAIGLLAQTPENLEGAFALEARLLDESIAEYGRARGREKSAIDELRRLSQQLDATLEDPNASYDSLTRLEAQLAVARDRACTRAQETAQVRQRMYDRMERLAGLAREFERQTELFGSARQGLSGTWQIEAQPIEVYGLLNLRLTGSQVSGPYRLSNGRQGAVRGTLAGDRLELQIVDSEHGVVATVTAVVDAGAGEIRGTWQAMELASGRPATGDWTAQRVSSEEEIDLGG